jgi:hypothetical protein
MPDQKKKGRSREVYRSLTFSLLPGSQQEKRSRPAFDAAVPLTGEGLFEFVRGYDLFLCELRDRGEYGVEAQCYINEEFLIGRRFGTRALAVQWAEEERKAIE